MNLTNKFLKAMSNLSENEGGYSNDPDDGGGESYAGISRKHNPSWIGWELIDKLRKMQEFPSNLDSNKDLQELILRFYFFTYWVPLKAETIESEDVAFSLFDFSINAGTGTCIKIIQEILNVKQDGIFGNKTLLALNSCDKKCFLAEFTIAKIKRYVKIVERNRSQTKFFYGWIRRALNL